MTKMNQRVDNHNIIKALKGTVCNLVDVLQWCSGSADFGVGGKARRGWLKLARPALKEANALLESLKDPEDSVGETK